MKQSDKTIKFINACETLISTGEVKNYAEIIDRLKWEKTMFSNVKNGRRNVPNYIFKKFSEVFHPIEQKAIVVEGEFNSIMGKRVATTAVIEAMLRVLRAELIELKSKVTKQPYAEIALEFDRIAEDELKHILETMKNES